MRASCIFVKFGCGCAFDQPAEDLQIACAPILLALEFLPKQQLLCSISQRTTTLILFLPRRPLWHHPSCPPP
uniref:Uncharacterized protein n=1 Tax=Triticum urartu TaxID=4572 RepID=A0A8R7TN24_TRIUA